MKTLLRLYFLFFLFLPFTLPAQTFLWEQNYGGSNEDRGYDIIATSDGNYMVAGWTGSSNNDVTSNNGSHDYWIAKVSPSGSLLWEQNYGGSGNDYLYCIRETNDKGFILAGNSNSSNGDVGGNNGQYDTWIVKVDSAGTLQWEQNYGGSDFDFGDYIEQTKDGGYIFLTNSASSDGDVGGNYGNRDIWIVKINGSGSIQWEQNYGGSDYDYPTGIRELPSGNFIVSGRTRSTDNDVSSIYGSYDAWVFKINSSGTLLWEQNFGGTSGELNNSMTMTSDYKILLAGRSTSSDNDLPGNYGNADVWVAKMDTNGTTDWFKNYGGSMFDEAHCIREAPDGNYIIAGSSQSSDNDVAANYGTYDYWALKLTNSGSIQWEKNYGGTTDDIAYAVVPTSGGKHMLLGRSESTDQDIGNNYGNFDYWLVGVDDTLINTSTGPEKRSGLANKQISVFPNPNTGNFSVDLGSSYKYVEYTLRDLRGKVLYQQREGGKSMLKLNLGDVAEGVYLLHINIEGSQFVEKLIVR